MNNMTRLICLIGILSLTGCGGAEDDHVHDEGTGAHSRNDADTHEHDDAEHAHEVPVTEAFYGGDADTRDADTGDANTGDAAADSHHDGELHTHDH